MDRLPFFAQRLFNTPLAIHPDKAEIVMAALADRLGVARLFSRDRLIVFDGQKTWDDDDDFARPARRAGYDVTRDGVAVIPVSGTLVQKLDSLRPYSGMTGYDGIRLNLLAALADGQVKAVMLDIDSPGGEVPGCFDLSDTIFAARNVKPIWAVLNEMAFSAAYALASAASRVTVPRTGGTGSIGVVYLHTDLSRALDQAGITVSVLRYGARKYEGNTVEPLSDAARTRIQADLNATGELFVATVARNRRLAADRVRDQEAACYRGQLGLGAGLADAVMAPDQAYRALLATLD